MIKLKEAKVAVGDDLQTSRLSGSDSRQRFDPIDATDFP